MKRTGPPKQIDGIIEGAFYSRGHKTVYLVTGFSTYQTPATVLFANCFGTKYCMPTDKFKEFVDSYAILPVIVTTPYTCPSCRSSGFFPSATTDGCSFCDGTEAGCSL